MRGWGDEFSAVKSRMSFEVGHPRGVPLRADLI